MPFISTQITTFFWGLKLKVDCLHGFFIFRETKVGQISDFMSLTGLKLVKWRDAYTFEGLEDAPGFSIVGKPVLGIPATATFEGEPWEVFEENELVFDFGKGIVSPIMAIAQTVKINLAGNRFVSSGLILPGSLTVDGKRVKDYSAWFSRDSLRWLYSAVDYV